MTKLTPEATNAELHLYRSQIYLSLAMLIVSWNPANTIVIV
jgi:hypothetical protein